MANLLFPETLSEVFITHMDEPGKFFVVPSDKVALLDSIWQEIEKELACVFSPSPASNGLLQTDFLNEFMPCIAQWQGRWYRARIVCRRPDGKFDVEYVDYGNTETVEASHVKKQPANTLINRQGRLAWPCRLNGEISRMDKKHFEEIYSETGGKFKMRVDDVDDETGQQVITLFVDTGTGGMKCVNEMITERAVGLLGQHVTGNIAPIPQAPIEPIAPSVMPVHRTFMGPIGGRTSIRRPTPTTVTNVESAVIEPQYPLVDLSEVPPLVPQNVPCSTNARNREPASAPVRFISDIDAILDGPADSDSEEEDERPAKGRNAPKGRTSSDRYDRRTWSVSSDSGQSGSNMDESVKMLKSRWAHVISLRYGTLKPPSPGTLSAEQQVTVTRVISPTEFYAQTMQQKDGLRRLELSMADEFHPGQMAIPVQLLSPNLCCAVYSDISKTWRRGRVLRVNRGWNGAVVTVDVLLVDTGFERSFIADAVKPINEHFTMYLPLAFSVALTHPYFESITWRPNDVDAFRRMVEDRTLIMKFVTDSQPTPEVELIDMSHNCSICANRVKKCTITERMVRWILQNGGLESRA